MKRHLWNLATLWRAVGLPGWATAGLIALCVVMWLGGIQPQRTGIGALEIESAALQQRIAAQASRPIPPDTSPRQQLALFMQRFPAESEMAGSVGVLNAVARRQGVQLNQAEFKFSVEPSGLLGRYSIVLPVKADYRALRGFIREAMREMPGLALEELNIRRSDAKSPVLEAQLRFVLFVAKSAPEPRVAAALTTNSLLR